MYTDKLGIPFYIGKGKNDRYKVGRHLYRNTSNNLLKNKIRKVGVDNVGVIFLHTNLSEEEVFRQEKYWINYYGRRDLEMGTLCNLTEGGEGNSGRKLSVISKRKISKALKGFQHSESTKRKLREIKEGHTVSIETRQKISKANKGKKRSKETCQKLSDVRKGKSSGMKGRIPWNKGITPSSEILQKMSKANKGQVPWNKGISHSIEHKQKLRDAWKRRKARNFV